MSLVVVDLLLDGPIELAFVGRRGDPGLAALRAEVADLYLPNRIVSHLDPGAPDDLPLLAGKTLVDGRAALYVCRDFACRWPVTDPDEVEPALADATAPGTESARPPALAPRLRSGRATAEGTARYAARQRAAATGYAPLGTTGLTASRVGFGGYRVDDDAPEHREALAAALVSGLNVIDTSTNYTDGGSERLVGAVLAELERRGDVRRDEVVVVSKAGYVQGANLERARAREAAGEPFPEMVRYADGVWHCVHPEFLRDQLGRSLERLQLETLDVLLLHNPEYYLSDAHERSHGTLDKRRQEFDRRIGEAFSWLEEEVRAGRIGAYGVSSNTCVRPASDPEFTSLTRMLELARKAGGEGHHFRVLQLPLNLMEPGAATERNNGPRLDRTVLEHAAAERIAVLANRPLNAMVAGGLLRLAMPEAPADAPGLEAALDAVSAAEAGYREQIASHLEGAEGSVPPDQFFRWGDDLRGVAGHVAGLEHWDALEQQRILPRLLQALEALDRTLTGPLVETWREWRAGYVPALRAALAAMRARAASKSRERAEGIAHALDPLLPAQMRRETLARKALWVVASLPGVSCVLLGARAPGYVDDAAAVLGWPPLEKAASALAAVAPKPD
jgi:hypothetical protein